MNADRFEIDLFGNERPVRKGAAAPPVALSLLDHAAESAALQTGRPKSQERAAIVAPIPDVLACGCNQAADPLDMRGAGLVSHDPRTCALFNERPAAAAAPNPAPTTCETCRRFGPPGGVNLRPRKPCRECGALKQTPTLPNTCPVHRCALLLEAGGAGKRSCPRCA